MISKFFLAIMMVVVLLVMVGIPAWAADPEVSVRQAADTIWTLVTAFLVFFMQAGFAMVEAGFTRAKNAGNIVMKNLMDFAVGSIAYWAVGFTLMFGVGSFIGSGSFFLGGSFEHLGLGISLPVFLLFQTVFAATAATIVSGAMAERTKFTSYLIYSAVISLIIYPVVGHWAWGGGWLSKLGFIDFAGSTVVHSVGGWAALMGATILGPRIGKYSPDGKVNAIPGHNLVIAALGVFILWFGWFGFNPGSTLSPFAPNLGLIAVTTNLAAAAGACVAMIVSWFKYGKPDVSMTLNGALAGLVAITAGCAAVSAEGSVLIGAIAGAAVIFAVEFFDNKAKIDDPVGAISVHGVCGALGTLMVGLFATDGGLFYGGGVKLLGVQALGVISTFLWTAATAGTLFLILKHTVGLRVKEVEETEGLDVHEHTSYAYPDMFTSSLKM
ncbi:ammonium transporter [Hydrogenispora ethanolica]|uniref:Ammonium transporter n=2 Tax=Hydrogenispora ethanolica TaxID=1082276 RepID=A0A4R1QQI8_HYDET|nr:ammonium transporter [Hydrogenispora ethanolica]